MERQRGFYAAAQALRVDGVHAPAVWLDQLLRTGVTAVIADRPDDASSLIDAVRRRGLSVPENLSVLSPDIPPNDGVGLTGMRVPRWETGRRAVKAVRPHVQEASAGTPYL